MSVAYSVHMTSLDKLLGSLVVDQEHRDGHDSEYANQRQ